MKIKVGALRKIVREELTRLYESEESHGYLDSPEGKKLVGNLVKVGEALSPALDTQFDMFLNFIRHGKLQNAMMVTQSIEQSIKKVEGESDKHAKLAHYWRENFKNFIEQLKNFSRQSKMQNIVGQPQAQKQQQQQTDEVDWSKELGGYGGAKRKAS